MCGRYVLALRPAEVRQQLEDSGMPVDEAPEDDAVRQSYNIAPGYYELVYRADVPDWGAGGKHHSEGGEALGPDPKKVKEKGDERAEEDKEAVKGTKYKLQAMKWGLIPFWTKRSPDYSSMLRTINCRDDSLAENRGMWTTMKQRKRCIVICQGFYEWLKKNGGKERIPYYVKRKDGQLMCFAGLWDCVQYEGSSEKLYTYTIITTSPSPQLKFLHDRMPVIFTPNSPSILTWLDPNRTTWTKELQSLLQPYDGELETYAVSKDVGKVGNNSPSFVVPVASVENKGNIRNFFKNAGKEKEGVKKEEEDVKKGIDEMASKHELITLQEPPGTTPPPPEPATPSRKRPQPSSPSSLSLKKHQKPSPTEPIRKSPRKPRSATSNNTAKKSASAAGKGDGGSQKITSFFG
ncbi:hypothetical protein FGG08_004467 [Glutinoglossum americanum]|uniref:Embryonic stem cell-specific 5-hydroxymethylcytosine-binding protein n=1 Tax=Glutinoglossum americanum TaxID=1670608 RepID=A0A9P8L2P3_9PEZI|nr:hypothetical protein FGG08_004467 [Glutinoglossum americanum]